MPRKRSATPDQARKRGRIACTSCRQAKVKCNFSEIPCSRCARLNIECSVNPEYKRTNKRDKVHELEDNVQALRSLIEKQQGTDNGDAVSAKTNVQSSDDHQLNGASSLTLPSPVGDEILPTSRIWVNENGSETRALGGVSLSSAKIESLFSLYFEKYHQHMPILDPARSPSVYYELSTPLFWTVVSVTLRSYRQENDTLEQLVPVLCTHLWSELGSSKKNLVGGKYSTCGVDLESEANTHSRS